MEEGCHRRMGGAKGMCIKNLSYSSHFKCLISYNSYHHPIRYIQLSPLDRGRKGSSTGLRGHPRLHREAGEPEIELLEGRTTLQFGTPGPNSIPGKG